MYMQNHTMEYYLALKKNEIMPLAVTRMDLKIILLILSEVSKTENDKYISSVGGM